MDNKKKGSNYSYQLEVEADKDYKESLLLSGNYESKQNSSRTTDKG